MRAPIIAAVVFGLCLSLQHVRAQTPPHDDDQEWNEIQITKPLTDTRDLVLTGQMRLGREFTHAVEEQFAAAVAFKPNARLTLTPGYAYVSQQPYAGRLVNQHRLVFTATGKFTWHAFTFTDRNQFEQRFVIANRDATVYRQRVTIDHPARLGAFKFKPFIWDEIRYSSQKVASGGRLGWYRNRLALGLSKSFTKQLTLDFFYLRQDDGVSRPGNLHAAGLSLRILLPARHAARNPTT